MNPRVLMLDEPTRHRRGQKARSIRCLAGPRIAILLVSSELEEVIGLCDRVIVLREGRISGTVTRERLTQNAWGRS
jgi:ribose transport system ATP-binding protein